MARAVAKELVQAGTDFIYAGAKGTPADVAAHAFLDELPEDQRELRLTTYLPKIPIQTERHDLQYEALGKALMLDDWPWQRRERMVRACDVMLMMGGRRGTGHNAALARSYKKPIVAIPHFGGFAYDEFRRLMEQYEEEGDEEALHYLQLVGNITLSPDQISTKAVESALWLTDHRSVKRRVFVAMPFVDDYKSRRDVEDAITAAVKSSLDWEVYLAKNAEIGKNKPLTQIIPELIRESGIIVVDLASNRPNVYYEAGIAHGLDLPTIFIAKEGEKPHFDLASHERIVWTDLHDLREKLASWLKDTATKI